MSHFSLCLKRLLCSIIMTQGEDCSKKAASRKLGKQYQDGGKRLVTNCQLSIQLRSIPSDFKGQNSTKFKLLPENEID